MLSLLTDDVRRNPYPLYDQFRSASPVLHDPQTGLWAVFDYAGVKRVLTDHDAFSSRCGPAEWLIFTDPPRQPKLRALIAQAFTPRSVANLAPRIRQLVGELLEAPLARGEMDLAADFAIPLPLLVIAEMLGIPVADRPRFMRSNEAILNMSYTIGRHDDAAAQAVREFGAATVEMNDYLTVLLAERQATPRDDLLTRLLAAEVDGERLTPQDILGFFQLLLLAGSETTTNLINNAILCFIEHPDQLTLLHAEPGLLPSAIEEVLRYHSPLQWMLRVTTREVELHGHTIPAGQVVLAVMGAANHDPLQFPDAARFDIRRDPNPHLAFGHGIHFCLGAALARLESRIALTELMARTRAIALESDAPWEPRQGLHVHGPNRLPIRFERVSQGGTA